MTENFDPKKEIGPEDKKEVFFLLARIKNFYSLEEIYPRAKEIEKKIKSKGVKPDHYKLWHMLLGSTMTPEDARDLPLDTEEKDIFKEIQATFLLEDNIQ